MLRKVFQIMWSAFVLSATVVIGVLVVCGLFAVPVASATWIQAVFPSTVPKMLSGVIGALGGMFLSVLVMVLVRGISQNRRVDAGMSSLGDWLLVQFRHLPK